MICGVDEAGRGPVLGPLVVAGVMVGDDGQLVEMGVRDSKQLSRRRRKELAERIVDLAEIDVVVIQHNEIDEWRGSMSLNLIEARAFASALNRLRPREAILDAADVNPDRFRSTVSSYLSFSLEIICQHKADEHYPVVSAASIVAKERRDSLMERIGEEIGEPVGSGYASDPVTRAFLEKWISENGDLPPYTRRSWETARRMLNLARTRRLTEWTDER